MNNKRLTIINVVARVLLSAVCITGIAIAAYQFADYKKSSTLYQKVVEGASSQMPDNNQNSASAILDNSDAAGNILKETAPIKIDFDKLCADNEETVAFIYFPNEQIGYPVVQRDDNSYYLNHMFNHKVGSAGCLFMDCNNSSDFSDDNSIIYGHHMKNGSMFGHLSKYKDQDYYNENSFFYLLTKDKNYRVSVYSAYVSDNNSNAWQINAETATAVKTKPESETEAKAATAASAVYLNWVNEVKAKSVIHCDKYESEGSEIQTPQVSKTLTLSTCDYSFDKAKLVVHGFLEEME